MKTVQSSPLALGVLLLLATLLPGNGSELPPSGTNSIHGRLRFVNADPAILARLGPPGNEGLAAFSVVAFTDSPEGLQATKNFTATDPIDSPYNLTVGAIDTPLAYHVRAYATLDGNEEYWTLTRPADPLTSNSVPATVDFDECVALIEFRYRNAAGEPVAALGGRATAIETAPSQLLRARYTSRPSGQTGNVLVVPSGVELAITVEVDTGTDIYLDRLTHRETHVMTLACDEAPVITITIPAEGTLGRIIGRANLVDRTEQATEGYQELLGRPVLRASGPSGNQRYAALAAEPADSDGPRAFALENLAPSTATESWRVQVETHFWRNNHFQFFQSPALGLGLNPGIEVTAGSTTDLADAFVMTPARLVGKVSLVGPPEAPGTVSALRGIRLAPDLDQDGDGLPDGIGAPGIRGSYVNVAGVDELAPGATLATTGANAASTLAGTYDPSTSAFEGNYEVTVGTIDDQPGLWRLDSLTYTIESPAAAGAPHVNQVGNIAERTPWTGSLKPGETVTNDLRYGFAEVCVRLRSPASFFNPTITASGSLDGADFEGRRRTYSVSGSTAYGEPTSPDLAQNEAVVTLYLPEGTYTLRPTITTIDAGGGESLTELPALEVTVGTRERVCVEDCLEVTLTPPACTPMFGFYNVATAVSCDGSLTNLLLTARPLANPDILLSMSSASRLTDSVAIMQRDMGLFPQSAPWPREFYRDILYTLTARDNRGRTATRTLLAHYDFAPPVVEVPEDIMVNAPDGVSTTVEFSVRTANPDDSVVCTPPSGSGFAVGQHIVTCVARDYCYNTNTVTFRVTVLPPVCPLAIEPVSPSTPQPLVTWDCGGILQSAPGLAGPWVDLQGATSPHAFDPLEPQAFFRLKFPTTGRALQFPGISGAVASAQCPPVDSFAVRLSVTAWIKTAQSTGAYPGLVTVWTGGSPVGWGLALNAGRLAPWYYGGLNSRVEPGFTGPNDRFVADDRWHHVAFVVDAIDGRTYIDGQLVNRSPWVGPARAVLINDPVRFGGYEGGSGLPYQGEMDEVTVWREALTAEQVSTMMLTGPAVLTPGLVGYWRFDETSGPFAADWSGSASHATVGPAVDRSISTAPITR